MKIITITLNPAFDLHIFMSSFALNMENYATEALKHAGGKGINISRALNNFGVQNTAYMVLGRDNADEFLSYLERDNLNCKYVLTDGRIRENITIHANEKETRISFEGFELKKDLLNDLSDLVKNDADADCLVTFTGRLPRGITTEDAKKFLTEIKKTGAKLIVDCNSFSKEDLSEIKPFLIKPNQEEINQLIGREIVGKEAVLKSAAYLKSLGVQNVMVTLGKDGLVFVGEDGTYDVKVPTINPVSTIGAGDSLIAGFVSALVSKKDITDTLKWAAASGSAACLSAGTNPPKAEDMSLLEKEVFCKRLA